MKQGWSYKKLGDVATYVNGFAFKPEQWATSGLPIIRIQNLNNPDAPYNYYEGSIPKQYYVFKGDLLISWSASLGTYIWNGDNALLNQHIFKVVFDKSDIDKYYLKYAVQSKLEAMGRLVHGATMKHIVKKDFDNTIIPVPSIDEQKAICSLLDKMNRVIEAKKEQLKELDKLAQAIFYDMFGDPTTNEKGWQKKKLEEILSVPSRNGLTKPTAIRGKGVPMISMGEMFANPIITNKVSASLVPVTEKELSSSQVFQGDLLFARQSLSLEGAGKCSYVESCISPTVFESHLIRIRINREIALPKFVFCFFSSPSGMLEVQKRVYQVAAAGIKSSELIQIPVPIPPLSLQQTFAEKVEAIERQKELINQSIKDVQTLFDAKMDYYFGD